jgi:putative Mg2+ transporter-C (MgtC) family protein
VHGLTTGAGMWLAGAIGLACGLGYWKIALLGAFLNVVVLAAFYRFAPDSNDDKPLSPPTKDGSSS